MGDRISDMGADVSMKMRVVGGGRREVGREMLRAAGCGLQRV